MTLKIQTKELSQRIDQVISYQEDYNEKLQFKVSMAS